MKKLNLNGSAWRAFAFKNSALLIAALSFTAFSSHAQWLLSGNTGTSPSTDFVGTTDNNDLVFRTNNVEGFRLTTAGNLGIGLGMAPYRLTVDGPAVAVNNTGSGLVHFTNLSGTSQFFSTSFSSNVCYIQAGGIGGATLPDMSLTAGGYARLNILAGGNVGVGITSPLFKLDVDGDINFPNTSALYLSGSRFLSIASDNTYMGISAGRFDAGSLNTFLGYSAGSDNVNGYDNTFVGSNAGAANTDGPDNTFIGHSAGQNNQTGINNTLTGSACGVGVGADNNSAYGFTALHNTETGSNNAVLGSYAAAGPGSGGSSSNNTIMGAFAAQTIHAGFDNVYIGYNSANQAASFSNNTFVGSGTYGDGDGNVYIGYNAHGVTGVSSLTNSAAIGTNSRVIANNTMALGGAVGSGSALTVVIGQTFPVGTSGLTPLSAAGSAGFNALEVNGDILTQGTLWYNSDKRFKKDIKDISDAKTLLNKLHPVIYQYRDDLYFTKAEGDNSKPVIMNFAKGEQIGFLAQELEEIMPYAVKDRADGYKSVNYNHFFGLLVQGFKEQDVVITESNKEIATLKEENTNLVSMIDEMKATMDEMKSRMTALEQKNGAGTTSSSTGESTNKARLEQNSPNPFSENTAIRYYVPENVKAARIVIRSSVNAAEVMSFEISHKGYGNMIVSGNTLTVGAYTCELYTEGELADIKKMILVK